MDVLKQTIQDFWNYLTGVIPVPVINALVAVTLMCIFYFLFLRWIISFSRNTKIIHCIDLIFMIILVCTVLIICLPSMSININKNISTDQLSTTAEILSTVEV